MNHPEDTPLYRAVIYILMGALLCIVAYDRAVPHDVTCEVRK